MYPKRVRTPLRVPTTNLPKSTVWFSWMLSKLTSHTFPWHDSVTLYFLPKLPSALDLTVSLAFMCSNVDISSSAHVDHKNCSANEHTTCENKIRSQFIPNFIHSCHCTCQLKNIQDSYHIRFSSVSLKTLERSICVFY